MTTNTHVNSGDWPEWYPTNEEVQVLQKLIGMAVESPRFASMTFWERSVAEKYALYIKNALRRNAL